MRITLLAPGRLKKTYLREGCRDFLSRLSHYVNVQVVEVREEPCGKGAAPETVKQKEAQRILERVPESAILVALDEHGVQMGSEELAALFCSWRDRGTRDVAFVIGGPLGLAPELLNRAQKRLSLSAMTFPHEFVRLIILEQFYRAFTIIHGEPYHNA